MDEQKVNISGVEPDLVSPVEKEIFSKGILANKKIAISVSVNEDLEENGFSEQHLNDISIEMARYIIANNGIAVYGGDLREGGFTYYFSELSNQYKVNNDKGFRFINYFVFPNTKRLSRDVRIEFLAKQIEVKEVPLPESITIDEHKEYRPFESLEDRYLYCECFKEMRVQMANDSDARILVGGKIQNYLGYVPGVIEEALHTFYNNKPVYLVGGFGGATEKLIQLIKQQTVDELTNDFQYSDDFMKAYKEYASSKCNYSDFDVLKKELHKFNLKKIAELNGLTVEENEILFSSKNIHEIVHLIMKGIKKS